MDTLTEVNTSQHDHTQNIDTDSNFIAYMPTKFLTFKLGEEEYGINILKVQEIRSYDIPTPIANAPNFIKGIINLRGNIVPILDLRLKLGFEDPQYNDFTAVIVLSAKDNVVGMVVDAVSEVIALNSENIKPMPAFDTSGNGGYIIGIGCINNGDKDRMLILTDIDALLDSSEIQQIKTDSGGTTTGSILEV